MPIYGGKALCAGSTSQFYVILHSCCFGLAAKDIVSFFLFGKGSALSVWKSIAEDVIKETKTGPG